MARGKRPNTNDMLFGGSSTVQKVVNQINEDGIDYLEELKSIEKIDTNEAIERKQRITPNREVWNGVDGIFNGFVIYSTCSEKVGMIDRFGRILPIPYRSNYGNNDIDKIFISYQYCQAKSGRPVPTLTYDEIVIDLGELDKTHNQNCFGNCAYIDEIDCLVGRYSSLTNGLVQHPRKVDEYKLMYDSCIDVGSIAKNISAFEFVININRNLEPSYHFDKLYAMFPWMSEPVLVNPTIMASRSDSEISVKIISRTEKDEDDENDEAKDSAFTVKTLLDVDIPKLTQNECKSVSLMNDKLKLFISPSKELVYKEAHIYKLEYDSLLMSKTDANREKELFTEDLRANVSKLTEELAEEKARVRKLNEIHRQEISNLKVKIDEKDSLIHNFKASGEVDKSRFEREVTVTKLEQEKEKTKQTKSKTRSENWKLAVTICTAIVSVVTLVITLIP